MTPLEGAEGQFMFSAVCNSSVAVRVLILAMAACLLKACAPPGSDMDKFERGYCFKQKRYLSDRELEDIAYAHIIGQLNTKPPSWYDKNDPNTVDYSTNDLERFRRLNPDDSGRNFREEFDENKVPPKIGAKNYDYDLDSHRFPGFVSVYVLRNSEETEGGARFDISACGEIHNFRWSQNLHSAPAWVKGVHKKSVE